MGDWVQRNGDRNRSFLSRVWSFMEMLDHSSLDDGNIDSMLVVPPCRTPCFSQHGGGGYDNKGRRFF